MVGSASGGSSGKQFAPSAAEPLEMESGLTCPYARPFSQAPGFPLRALDGMGLYTDVHRQRCVLLELTQVVACSYLCPYRMANNSHSESRLRTSFRVHSSSQQHTKETCDLREFQLTFSNSRMGSTFSNATVFAIQPQSSPGCSRSPASGLSISQRPLS